MEQTKPLTCWWDVLYRGVAMVKSEVCITVPILEGLDGVNKCQIFSNYIGVFDTQAQCTKILSMPDSSLNATLILLSFKSLDEIKTCWMKWLRVVTTRNQTYLGTWDWWNVSHDAEAAENAQRAQAIVTEGEVPEDTPSDDFSWWVWWWVIYCPLFFVLLV